MPKITFQPSGVTIDVKPGTTVFHAAARAEVPIASQCGGKCACALCRVKVVGEALIAPMGWEEEGHMGNAFFITGERLSCQLKVFSDITIEVKEPETKEKPKSRYIPHSLVRKRERMEREADVASATDHSRPPVRRPPPRGPRRGPPRTNAPRQDSTDGEKSSFKRGPTPEATTKPPSKRRRRSRRSRNPGAPRSGDSRAPAGAKKKEEPKG